MVYFKGVFGRNSFVPTPEPCEHRHFLWIHIHTIKRALAHDLAPRSTSPHGVIEYSSVRFDIEIGVEVGVNATPNRR
jgi:hypothetical protein